MSQIEPCRVVVWIQENEEIGMAPTITRSQPDRDNLGHIIKKSKREKQATSIVNRAPRKSRRRMEEFSEGDSRKLYKSLPNRLQELKK